MPPLPRLAQDQGLTEGHFPPFPAHLSEGRRHPLVHWHQQLAPAHHLDARAPSPSPRPCPSPVRLLLLLLLPSRPSRGC